MKNKDDVYVFKCIVCGKVFRTWDTTMFHCGRLTQWVEGIPKLREEMKGKSIKSSDRIKIRVSGYIEIERGILSKILKSGDPFGGLINSMSQEFVNVDNLEFDLQDQ